MSTFGSQLKHYRSELKLNQPEFAEQVGIEQSYLSKLENDKSVPSNDTFRSILAALNLTICDFMQPLKHSVDKARLINVPDIEAWYKQQTNKQFIKQRSLIYSAILISALGCALFYLGHQEKLFNTEFYEYKSYGVVKDNEPDGIFYDWRTLLVDKSGENIDAKHREMTNRRDFKFIISPDYKGTSFVESGEQGRRLFSVTSKTPIIKSHKGHVWLEFVGILLVVIGAGLIAFESKLTKHS
ncbi:MULTISPECIES: helix-turn-helix domain-containing protein [Pseudoalteromonas]|uniref:helix-turn-helix domain-containing protein n=1 Tax=Pseudoalteromonas sp. JSTW TaxID=2752475 RepID=UPI0015D5589C|nr:helix-turn-helix transcriptional regulator [Pseudoalteromonas sp. JSTW]QLJ07166.1 helix-turn-helix transcriptional regulator [Pseudoalteromonas sp. JSTW]